MNDNPEDDLADELVDTEFLEALWVINVVEDLVTVPLLVDSIIW